MLLRVIVMMLLSTGAAHAQVPAVVNYQGRLVDGTNVANGTVGLSLRIFDAPSGGALLYEDSNTVSVVDGIYSTYLGDNTTAGSLTNALAATNAHVEVAVNGVALSPRERITSVAYAMNVRAGAIGPLQLAKDYQSGTVVITGLNFAARRNFSGLFSPAFSVSPIVTLALESSWPQLNDFGARLSVQSKSNLGFIATVALPPIAPVSAATNGDAGGDSSLRVISSNPAIAYLEFNNEDLLYVRALDETGSQWAPPVVVDTNGTAGYYPSLAVANGNPAISYFAVSNGLKYVRAANTDGSVWGAPVTVDSSNNVGAFTCLVIVNARPAISYYDSPAGDLKYARATNADGTAWSAPIRVDTNLNVGQYALMAVVNGNPAISYYDSTSNDLKYIRAVNADGTAWGTPIRLHTAGTVGLFTSLAVVNGFPAISYGDYDANALMYVRALDINGTNWSAPVVVETNIEVGYSTSLSVVNGRPAIAYTDFGVADVKYVEALDSGGTNWAAPVRLETEGEFYAPSIDTVGNNPAISYYDSTNGNLRFVIDPVGDFTINWIAVEP